MAHAKGAPRYLWGLLVLVATLASKSPAQDDPVRSQAHGVLANDFRGPISFEPNQGQTDSRVRFIARGSGYNLLLTPSNALLVLGRDPSSNNLVPTNTNVVTMNVVGANPAPKISGRDELPGRSSYFLGSDPSHWHINIPNFGKVHYESIYPGIDLVYHGTQGQLEYDFILHPGTNPDVIVIEFTGAKDIRLSRSGELVLRTEHGKLCFHPPTAYQWDQGTRHTVPVHYRRIRKQQFGFVVAAYDTGNVLIIDPVLTAEHFAGQGPWKPATAGPVPPPRHSVSKPGTPQRTGRTSRRGGQVSAHRLKGLHDRKGTLSQSTGSAHNSPTAGPRVAHRSSSTANRCLLETVCREKLS